MFKKVAAGILLATLALTAMAPVASANSSLNVTEKLVALNDNTSAFDTLVEAAVCTPGIAEALATTEGITLFAPTDGAFRKLGRQLGLGKKGLTPDNVCTLPTEVLADVLTYHVYGDGAVKFRDAVKLSPANLTMLNGDKAKLRGRWFNLRIDGARIILPDIGASNGIIHVVRGVMTPPGL